MLCLVGMHARVCVFVLVGGWVCALMLCLDGGHVRLCVCVFMGLCVLMLCLAGRCVYTGLGVFTHRLACKLS